MRLSPSAAQSCRLVVLGTGFGYSAGFEKGIREVGARRGVRRLQPNRRFEFGNGLVQAVTAGENYAIIEMGRGVARIEMHRLSELIQGFIAAARFQQGNAQVDTGGGVI